MASADFAVISNLAKHGGEGDTVGGSKHSHFAAVGALLSDIDQAPSLDLLSHLQYIINKTKQEKVEVVISIIIVICISLAQISGASRSHHVIREE
jgi:hypothetical protein